MTERDLLDKIAILANISPERLDITPCVPDEALFHVDRSLMLDKTKVRCFWGGAPTSDKLAEMANWIKKEILLRKKDE